MTRNAYEYVGVIYVTVTYNDLLQGNVRGRSSIIRADYATTCYFLTIYMYTLIVHKNTVFS